MNIYWRELKTHRWGVLFWSLGMVALVGAGMAKYGAYAAAGTSVTDMFAQVPKAVMVVFGLGGFDLTKASDFYGVLFLYIAVMAAIHASLLGSNLISKEERDRTSEFLYAKPISRARVLTSKLLAGLTMVLVFNLATSLSSLCFVAYFGKGESFNAEIWLLMAGLLFVQLIFFAIGALVASIVHRPKAAPSIATSVMFLTFLVYYVVNFDSGLEFLRWFSPFKYFDAVALLASGQLDLAYVALSVAIIVLCIFGAYRFYSARDLAV
jgi:ABC-2 type transport system permease protein